nr:UDP-glucuronic acid decarboxylase 6-like [Tanacetum cinerariifolium]
MATNGNSYATTTKPPPNPSPLRNAKFYQANMRILVTGGAGFIGSHLVDRLMQNEKNEVIVVDNYFTGSKDNLRQWIGHPRFELIRHDVTQPLLVETVKELINPSVEIRHVDNTPDDPRQRKPVITKANELLGCPMAWRHGVIGGRSVLCVVVDSGILGTLPTAPHDGTNGYLVL